jgi:hypothetical protein
VAQEWGVSPELIYRWRTESKRICIGGFPGEGRPKKTSHEAELAQLMSELSSGEWSVMSEKSHR